MRNKRIVILIILILISIITLIGSSYALLTKSFKGDKLSMQVGTLKVDFTEGNAINMNNTIPMSDTDGLATTPYTFTITNSGTIDAYYTVSNEEDSSNTLDTTYLKMKITSDDGYDSGIVTLKSLGSKTYRIIDEKILKTNKSITYKLYLWISGDTGNDIQDKTYKSKIVVNSTSNRVGDTYCKDNGFTNLSDCMLVISNHETTVESAKSTIRAKGTPDFTQVATTDEGLYMAEDDEGESYYYRGAVKNNYVSFAGFIWRIIRRNGDGSIRMIYSGKSTSDTGDAVTIGNSAFNDKYWDPTYVGYKYNEDFSLHENNGITNYVAFANSQKYNFGTEYTFDQSTKKFTLTGDIKQLTWSDNHDEIVNKQLYSCLSTNCNVVYKVTGYKDSTTMIVQPLTFSSNSYENAVTNSKNSTVKNFLDEWYKNNLVDYTKYISDATFCNSRGINYGSGYSLDGTTTYEAYGRVIEKKSPTFKCPRIGDRFKLSNENAKLDYSISLITVDEAIMAGATFGKNNKNYYLYNNHYTWTLSPSDFYSLRSAACVFYIEASGNLGDGSSSAAIFSVRPVINLRADVQIIRGDGSSLNPFVIR